EWCGGPRLILGVRGDCCMSVRPLKSVLAALVFTVSAGAVAAARTPGKPQTKGSPRAAAPAASTQNRVVDYNRDVRPILAENCFACHGADGNKRQANLRLDQAQSAFAVLASGHAAVVPGKPNASELVK